jgi:NAD(P)-dependent dehydrogenase (short-subunit alcohol dehydrogenase family)
MRLEDKIAIVTGAAHGMGEAEARLFAREGAKVVVADVLGEQAEAVAADIRAGGGEATAATIDVTSEPAWVALIEKTVARYGRLDILVNNAGISGSSVGDPDGLEGRRRRADLRTDILRIPGPLDVIFRPWGFRGNEVRSQPTR